MPFYFQTIQTIELSSEIKKKITQTKSRPILKSTRKHWFVLYCKPNSEKKTAERLNAMGIKCYCPTQVQMRQWSDRKKKVQVPVLPSMVLVYVAEINRQRVFETPTAVRYLYWLKKPATVTEQEIKQLQSALRNNYKAIEIEKIHSKTSKVKLKGLGTEPQNGHLKYSSKTHDYIELEQLGVVVKVKR